MGKTRVLVVEDSVTIRKRLVEVLNADSDMEVVGEAGDGKTAIELCRELRPDVITLDMMLPVMSGLAATEYIMAYCPTPILIVSSSANRGEVFKTYDALAAGALDVLDKPGENEADGEWERTLTAAVKLVSRIKVITHVRGRFASPSPQALRQPPPPAWTPATHAAPRLVALGASTGGPAAVAGIIRCLPAEFPLPILLVVHIGSRFSAFLAEWFSSQAALPVRCATDGEPLPQPGQGRLIMAPADRHLVVCDGRLRLTLGPERHSCRPSVDVLFESLARECAPQVIAGLLTGMGKDGALGLLAIRQAGGRTIAQDEATSIVFGMPAEAIRLGAAEKVLSLDEFAPALLALAGHSKREGR